MRDTSNNKPSTKETWIDEASEKEIFTQDSIGIIINNKKYATRLISGNGKSSLGDVPGPDDDKFERGQRKYSNDESSLNILSAKVKDSTEDAKIQLILEMRNMIEDNRKDMRIAIEDNRKEMVRMMEESQKEIERLTERDKVLCKKAKKIIGYEIRL